MSGWTRWLVLLAIIPLIGVIVLLLLWWLYYQQEEATASKPVTIRIDAEPTQRVTVPVVKTTFPSPDNLKRIEGIGPKISSVLNEAGVTTYEQLASMSVEQLQEILREGGVRIGDPSTWPEQASLAAVDEWDALAAFQATLKGGRRVN